MGPHLSTAGCSKGRITKKIHFGKIKKKEIVELFEWFWGEDDMKTVSLDGVKGGLLTPALVEVLVRVLCH